MTDHELFHLAKWSVSGPAWDAYRRAGRVIDPGTAANSYTEERFKWCLDHPEWLEAIVLVRLRG